MPSMSRKLFICSIVLLFLLLIRIGNVEGLARSAFHLPISMNKVSLLRALPDPSPSQAKDNSLIEFGRLDQLNLDMIEEGYHSADLDWDWTQVSRMALPVALLLFGASIAQALPTSMILSDTSLTSMQLFDPSKFQPVCPASDGLYQVMKGVANTLIGQENVIEYGPLVASVLLRVRLELCVFESFVYEAVIPFVKQKGLSWVLPLHETLETFLAGTIFAVASNFILLGSTKIITVLLIYFDALFGLPARFVGNLMVKWSKDKSKVGNAGTVLKFAGDIFGAVRRSVEVIDTFVGRYLVFGTTAYIIFKFVHYKFFNEILPF